MHSPVDGYLNRFPVLAVMYNAAINILLNVFWCTCASCSEGSPSGTTSSESLRRFKFAGVANLLCRRL